MSKKKKDLFNKDLKENLSKSVDELDEVIRVGSQRFLDTLINIAVKKVASAWELKKEMLQDAIKEGREDGNSKRQSKQKSRPKKSS